MPVAPKAVIASPSDDEPEEVACDRPDRGLDPALREPAEFERCLARPALVKSGPFALHLSWRQDPAAQSAVPPCTWRLGLVIPKRYEASAVARNTIKRRWRAAFRRGREAWASEFGSADVVVRMQAPLVPKSEVAEPARVRARDRFDPQTLFDALAVRLRGRRRAAVAASVVLSANSAIQGA